MISGNGNTSQRHGIDFENLIKSSWMFDGACDAFRLRNGIIDIEGKHDKVFHLNTSVKAVHQGGWIGLADATRFYDIQVPWRFIIGEWIQISPTQKTFIAVHEFILTPAILKVIRGSILADDVEKWHLTIASYPDGIEGAVGAREEKKKIFEAIKGNHHKVLRFDFKIGNVEERRLQLSLNLKGLIKLIAEITKDGSEYECRGSSQPYYVQHKDFFCQYPIPFDLRSPERRIIKTTNAPSTEMEGTLFEDLPLVEAPKIKMTKSPRRRDQRRNVLDKDLNDALFGQ